MKKNTKREHILLINLHNAIKIYTHTVHHFVAEYVSHSTHLSTGIFLRFVICTAITKIGSLLLKGHISIYGFIIIILDLSLLLSNPREKIDHIKNDTFPQYKMFSISFSLHSFQDYSERWYFDDIVQCVHAMQNIANNNQIINIQIQISIKLIFAKLN